MHLYSDSLTRSIVKFLPLFDKKNVKNWYRSKLESGKSMRPSESLWIYTDILADFS